MRDIRARCGLPAALLFAGASMAFGAEKGVEIEYVGHACFVLQSPAGVRLVIDPCNGKRWLGYDFPDDVRAHAVLVSHPHYDHDASYYFGTRVPVFREPGRYAIGDVSVQGFKGRHAGSYGRDFEQKNTIWLVEAGGLRLAHLGDNGPLTADNAAMLGRVDVLFLPADGEDHILTPGRSTPFAALSGRRSSSRCTIGSTGSSGFRPLSGRSTRGLRSKRT